MYPITFTTFTFILNHPPCTLRAEFGDAGVLWVGPCHHLSVLPSQIIVRRFISNKQTKITESGPDPRQHWPQIFLSLAGHRKYLLSPEPDKIVAILR